MTWPFMDTTPPEPMPGADDRRGATPFPLGAASGDRLIVGGACLLMGWALKEASGAAPASLEFWSGAVTIGLLVAPVTFLANETPRDWFPPYGILCNGLTLHVISGTVGGTVFVIPL